MTLRRILAIVLCFCLLLPMISGCTPDDLTDGSNPTTKPLPQDQDDIIDVGYEALPCTEQELYDQLFDLNNKVTIDLDMAEEELQKMQNDYEVYRDKGSKSPIYRKATVTITITTSAGSTAYRIDEVGVRMKGNTSRTSFYDPNEGGIYKFIHFRLDFQETFDDEAHYGSEVKVWSSKDARNERKDRTFAMLEKLELRWNKCYDSTYMKETYAYELYRSEGVLAPMANLSSLDWSGVHMGVYVMVEPIDEAFLAKRLQPEDLGGDLYKLGWTYEGAKFTNLNSVGIENEDNGEFYIFDLKSNKKTSQHESLTNLITKLNTGTFTKESFGELVDVENFLSYAAVSYFLGNPDDLRNNYNNVYLYFLASSGKAVIIPYDYDRCLGVTYEYNPSGHALTTDNPFSELREAGQHGPEKQENPLFIYSVDKGGYYVAEYADVLNRVAGNDLLKENTFARYFDRAASLYQFDVQPDRELHNAGGRNFAFDNNRTGTASSNDNMSFADYIQLKMTYFNLYMGKLEEYLGYERPVPADYYIRGDFNGWSNQDEYAMTMEDGLLTFTLRFNHDFSFKVFHNPSGSWYGVECLPEDSELVYTTDDHGNFDLQAGTYHITFDPENQIITVTKQ